MPRAVDSQLPLSELSDLIGAIYDCAVTPEGWEEVLRRITHVLQAATSAVYLIDLDLMRPRLFSQWGMPPEAVAQWMGAFATEVAALHDEVVRRTGTDADEPQVFSELFSAREREALEVNRDWARALGVCDVVAAMVSTSPRRVGFLAANRHDSVGLATPREVAIMRLLAPHVRQAIRIGDLLEMRRLTTSTIASTIDALEIAVVVLDARDRRILHRNDAARRLLQDGGPFADAGGRLVARDGADESDPAGFLSELETQARATVVSPGYRRIVSQMIRSQQGWLHAHLVPLPASAAAGAVAAQPIWALLIAGADGPSASLIDAFAGTHGLTTAEARVLEPAMRGLDVPEIARLLGLSVNTIKSQMKQIFKKIGVERQAELVAVARHLIAPIRRDAGGSDLP